MPTTTDLLARDGESPRPADRRGEGALRRVAFGAALSLSAAAIAYAVGPGLEPRGTLPAQALCLTAAAAWLALATVPAARAWRPRRLTAASVAPVVAILAVAFVLRADLGSVLPLPERTGFEELQMGSDCHALLRTGVLPLEFRFSKAIGALGLRWGGNTVDALRVPFRVMGYARLALVLACLRTLGVGWWATAFVTVAMAASRWFVISGGAAYEDFSAALPMLLLILCLLKLTPLRRASAAWAGWAGASAGTLAFENSSFRFAILLGLAWVVWLAAVRWRREPPARWLPAAVFGVVAGLVAAPMLVDVARHGVRSIFFEAFARYGAGRATVLSPVLTDGLMQSFRLLAGLRVRISYCLAPEADYAVHPLLGALFMAGAVAGLLRPKRPAVRALVLGAAFAVVVCSAATNFFMATRLAAVMPLLVLSAGAFLGQVEAGVGAVLRRAAEAVAPRSRALIGAARAATPALFVALTAVVVVGSSRRVLAMAGDPDVRRDYRNNQYLVASHLSREVPPGSRVLVVTPGLTRDWSERGIAQWVFADRHLQVAAASDLPAAGTLRPAEIVVLSAEARSLRDEELDRFRELAREAGAGDDVRIRLGSSGRPIVASFVASRALSD